MMKAATELPAALDFYEACLQHTVLNVLPPDGRRRPRVEYNR